MNRRQPTRKKKWQELKDQVGHAYNIINELMSEEGEGAEHTRWSATIAPDRTVDWHGVDTGKVTVMDMNEDQGLIVLKFAGGTFWSGLGYRKYAPAHFQVHAFEVAKKHDDGTIDIRIYDLFGHLRWPVRAQKKEN